MYSLEMGVPACLEGTDCKRSLPVEAGSLRKWKILTNDTTSSIIEDAFDDTSRQVHRTHTSSPPPEAKFRDVRQLLEMFDWTHDRTAGSHEVFTKPGERTLPVPVHNGDVKRVYLDRICDLLDLDTETETD